MLFSLSKFAYTQQLNLKMGLMGGISIDNLYLVETGPFDSEYKETLGSQLGIAMKFGIDSIKIIENINLNFNVGRQSNGMRLYYSYIARDPNDPNIPDYTQTINSYLLMNFGVGYRFLKIKQHNFSVNYHSIFQRFYNTKDFTVNQDKSKQSISKIDKSSYYDYDKNGIQLGAGYFYDFRKYSVGLDMAYYQLNQKFDNQYTLKNQNGYLVNISVLRKLK